MSLSWRDVVATILLIVAGVITYAQLAGFQWPWLGNVRIASLVLLAIGVGMCIVSSSGAVPPKTVWTVVIGVFGGAALVLALLGLVFNNQIFLLLLATDIGLLWLLTTVHHAISA